VTEANRSFSDDVVMTEAEFRRLAGNLSRRTVRRLDQRGEGPPKIQLSARRIGRRLGDVRAWLQSRQNAGPHPSGANPQKKTPAAQPG
jgi:predicted DNA-binding transcriptional regulator AlpA